MARLLAIAVMLMGAQMPAVAQSLSLVEARKAILAERNRLWRDPDSIRDGRITPPHPCPHRPPGAVCVCVEANAKNAMGGYTGITKTRIYFAGAKIVEAIGPLGTAAPDQCGAFQPFPEINGKR